MQPHLVEPSEWHVSWRAAIEPRVRTWWVAGGLVLALAVYYACCNTYTWNDRRKLLTFGDHVDALVADAPDHDMHRRGQMAEPFWSVVLTFEHNGGQQRVSGWLTDRKEPIPLQSFVPIRVDKNDAMHWTYESPLPALWQALTGLALLLPLMIGFFGMAIFRWRRLRYCWANGQPAVVVVRVVRLTAMAADSAMLLAVREDEVDAHGAKLLTAYVPRQLHPRVGDAVDVRIAPDVPGQVLAVAWFA